MKRLVSILACLVFTAACGGPQTVGVRKPFRNTQVTEVTVVRFFALSDFGRTSEEMNSTLRSYEKATIDWLHDSGVDVTSPDALQARLEGQDLAQVFEDGVSFDRPLRALFEPAETGKPLESETVRVLASKGAFPTSALLFGEVVYQTIGECEGDPREYNQRAVKLAPVGEVSTPSDCVVAHIEAKLVDVASGSTMWSNRLLVEQWFDGDADKVERRTIVRVVEMTLDGQQGLAPLIGRADQR